MQEDLFADLLLEDCCEQFKIKKSLINSDQNSFTREIHEEVFQEKEVHETFSSFQDSRHHDQHSLTDEIHEEISHCEAQSSIEGNIENHTVYEGL